MSELSHYEKTGYLHDDFKIFHLKDTSMRPIDFHYHDFHKILIFRKGNISYKVNVNSKESCLECIKQLRENTGRNFRWFKETTGNRHWVIYDSDMYEISNKCDTNLLGLEKFDYLHYKEELYVLSMQFNQIIYIRKGII